jgi:hypothetical protein
MQKLFLLGTLSPNYVRWYHSTDASSTVRAPPQVKLKDAQLYINKSKFEVIFRYLTMYAR